MALFTPNVFKRTSPYTQARVTTPETQPRAATAPVTTTQATAPATTQAAPAAQTAQTVQGVPSDQWFTQTKSYQDYLSDYEKAWAQIVATERAGSRNPERFSDPAFKRDLMAMRGWYDPSTQTTVTIEDDQGNPIATGYWINGSFYVTNDLRPLNAAQTAMGNQTIPTFTDWMGEKGYQTQDVTESTAWQGLQNLISGISDPAQQQAWQDEGINWAEQLLGVEPGGYQGTMQGLLYGMDEVRGRDPFQLTDEQSRRLATGTSDLREEMKLTLEALGASGRSVAALVAADEMTSQIANESLKQRMEYANFNFAKNEADYAAMEQRYQMMVSTGAMTATEYVQRQREHAGAQLAMYAQEISMIESANSQYLMEYQADLAGMQASAQQVYNQIQMTLGVDSALLEQANQWYEMMLAPIQLQMQQAALALEQQKADQASEQALWGSVLDLLGTGASALLGNWGAVFGQAATT